MEFTNDDVRLMGEVHGESNQTSGETHIGATLIQQVEDTAKLRPNSIALERGTTQLSYQQLLCQVNKCATYIREEYGAATGKILQPDTPIIVCLERNTDLIIGLLGIMKAGAAYVPVSPDYPVERMAYMLEDTGCELILTDTTQKGLFEKCRFDGVCLDIANIAQVEEKVLDQQYATASDLAYIIYTSGTTGRPKGVMMEHGAFAGFVKGMAQKFDGVPINLLSYTNVTFDIFGLEYAWPLITGGKLILADLTEVPKKSDDFWYGVDVIQQTPSTWQLFMDQASQKAPLHHIKVIVGGESCPEQLFEALDERFEQVLQVYGPTESCIWSSSAFYQKGEARNIGKALPGEQLWVLNEQLEPVRPGEVGELYITGAGLARGYFKRPDLTKARFPFMALQGNAKQRFYKTGDLVALREDQQINFVGRMDNQVKIQGHRIELGEIEQVLLNTGKLTQVAVVAKERQTGKYLLAYFIPNASDVTQKDLQTKAATFLPGYMMPSVWMEMESFPLTANGKIDRDAFPEPTFESDKAYVAPQTELQKNLCTLWEQVLNVDRVGINDNFFGLGGSSIHAIRLSAKAYKNFQLEVPLALLYRTETIAELSKVLVEDQLTCIPVSGATKYPLAFAQERLLFIEQYEGGTDAYHLPYLAKLHQETDLTALEQAFEKILDHHSILRTAYLKDNNGHNYQRVLATNWHIQYESVTDEAEMLKAVDTAIAQPFDLVTEPSMRVYVYSFGNEQHLLILWHHIAFDGWSTNIFLRELASWYTYFSGAAETTIAAPEIAYVDYAAWQHSEAFAATLSASKVYWLEHLSGFEPLDVPSDFMRPTQIEYTGKDVPFKMDAALSERVADFAKAQETTAYSILLSGFYLLLGLYSRQNDIVIGAPSENRSQPQTQDLLGFFVNTLPMRVQLDQEATVADLVQQVHQVVKNMKSHQEMPLERLVDAMKLERDPSRHPIFQVIFSLQDFGEEQLHYDGLPFEPVNRAEKEGIYTPARYDLSLLLNSTPEGYQGVFNYASHLYKPETVTRMCTVFNRLVEGMIADEHQKLGELPLLSEQEYTEMIIDWNANNGNYPTEQTIRERFESMAADRAETLAIRHNNNTLTFGELNIRANQLAHYLLSSYKDQFGEDMKPGTYVAIQLDRSIETAVAILAVLKAGGVYVPLSPDVPKERMNFMLNDTKAAAMLLRQEDMLSMVMDGNLEGLNVVPALVMVDDPKLHSLPAENPLTTTKASDLAYVIYTSGTTGKPKGVMVDNEAVISFVHQNDYIRDDEVASVASLSPASFDGFVFDLFYALLNGAAVHLIDKSLALETTALCTYLHEHKVEAMFCTTALFNQLVTNGDLANAGLRYLLCGGEKANVSIINEAIRSCPQTHFVHVYGPTETVVFASAYLFEKETITAAPIGGPLKNKRFYVLDNAGRPVPIGVPGELYIAGAGLANGYLNNQRLTAERFLPNPFATEADEQRGFGHMYRTGDVVRWLPDGIVEFVGRVDQQLKIRGHRIEPSEIEHVLKEMEVVNDAAVVVLERDGSKQLAAYVVAENDAKPDTLTLVAGLRKSLPDYMIPATFTLMEQLPLTVNGKLDKRSLPDPEVDPVDDYVGPRNAIEEQLCAVLQEVLSIDRVGIHDNFFQVGGDSIVAIRAVAKCKTQGLSFTVQDLFVKPTIAALSEVVSTRDDEQEVYTPFSLISESQKQQLLSQYKTNLTDAYPATTLQMGMLLESTRDVGVYHDVLTWHIHQPFDKQIFEALLVQLVQKHEALRTGFIADEEVGFIGVVVSNMLPSLEVVIDATSIEEVVDQELHKGFDLDGAGLYRFVVHNITEDAFHFTFSLHHAIIDGWSVASLIAELNHHYSTQSKIESAVSLPLFGAYVKHEMAVLSDGKTDAFWREYLHGYASPDFPFVQQALSNEIVQEHAVYRLNAEQSQAILERAQSLQVQVDTLFLAMYQHALQVFNGVDDLMIGLVTNNRLQETGGDQLLGLFLNTIPFRPGHEDGVKNKLRDWLVHVANEKMRVLQYKALPFPVIKSKWLSDELTYQCAFNYIHFHVAQGDLTVDNTPVHEYEKINIPMLLTVARENDVFLMSVAVHKKSVEAFAFKQFWHLYTNLVLNLTLSETALDQPVSQLTPKDQKQLTDWNCTPPAGPVDKTLQEVFEAQVVKTPNAPALICGDQQLDYLTLNTEANQLAHFIRREHLAVTGTVMPSGAPVALFLDRSIEMVVSMLAVLKAGGAFVPISTEHPKERVEYLLTNAKASMVLTQQKYLDQLSPAIDASGCVALVVDDQTSRNTLLDTNLNKMSAPEEVAYVIYTSGTTGKPKGVAISHRASVSRNHFMASRGRTKNNVYLFKTNYIFDVSVSDIFSHLFVGAPILIAKAVFDLDEIQSSLTRYNVNATHFVPSQFTALTKGAHFHQQFRQLYFSGENLGRDQLQHIDFDKTRVLNYYGPTETGEATVHQPTSILETGIIGKPFDGTALFVLDRHQKPVPVGCQGELYIGGAGVANGYLNQPTLTAERFLQIPSLTAGMNLHSNVVYRTGDLVRWNAEGNLVYLGRMDKQVKIHGHRIELEEIEAVLRQHKSVEKAVVVDVEREAGTFLAAYIIAVEGDALNTLALNSFLEERLPEYMVPSTFTTITELPLTGNGKLNRSALPDPEFKSSETYKAPTNDLEAQLVDIWQEVLHVERVGINDSFFRLGGNSMNAIRLTAISRKRLNKDIPLTMLFDCKTVAAVAKRLNGLENVTITAAQTSTTNLASQTNKMSL